ncbi:MAG: preprotein translocase subunit YajC [Eubacterium sp.]|jgi:preprotein translocase subunit YajC|nr:preprotein translocase subunit YajC [Eubacterium sp.]
MILAGITASADATGGIASMVISLVIMVAFLYFFMLRPQQKEQKKKDAMLAALEVGDTILTTSGFYGTIIDISDDTVIVEFGSNKNCRIPMQRAAISVVEKPENAANAVENKKSK